MSSNTSNSFWLCHECGAQMRPIQRDGVYHCASCDGEFIEILDPSVNPDPQRELPPAPPTRPGESSNQAVGMPGQHPFPDDGGAGYLSSLFGSFFGGAGQNPNANQDVGRPGSAPPGSGSGGRAFTFNMPGGGRGQVMFGSFNGMNGPFGGAGGPAGPFDSLFPGFNPPRADAGAQQPLGPNDPMGPEELIRSLMTALQADGELPMMGVPGRANLGDYVMTQNGFDQILESLMQAAGPQGPLPASDVVIEGLPRFKLTEETLEQSQFKDCPVCKDDLKPGDEVKRIPCKHIFHPDCIDPWLRVNGSCPVCRFSLVPEEANRRPTNASTPSTPQPTPPPGQGAANQTSRDPISTVTNILQRLWGQSGSSNPTSPTAETRPPAFPPTSETAVPPPPPPTETQSSTSGPIPQSSSDAGPAASLLPNSIPEDYRERHRQRERDQREEPPEDDLD